MIPAAFEYHAPASIGEATALLARLGDDAKILSGGQSLIPLMKLRLASPGHLVDINGLPGLAYVREAGGSLRIGALTREADLEEAEVVRTRYPLLHDTCRVIADPLVRNLATVGGNLAHGDPANDHPATMLALDAEVVATGPGGERRIPIASFFTGPFETALRPDEILVEIRIPVPPARSGGASLKLERKGAPSAGLSSAPAVEGQAERNRRMRVELSINGEQHAADVEPRLLLVHLIREVLRLTGTHIGCDTSHCGACTILMDGRPVKSCTVFAVQAHGKDLMTVERLEQDDKLHPLQEGFMAEHGLQCGYCTPGMLMTSYAFLKKHPAPTEDDIRWAISGNLCRCIGYLNIVKAVQYAAAKLRDGGA